jgi:hypothetical protein
MVHTYVMVCQFFSSVSLDPVGKEEEVKEGKR